MVRRGLKTTVIATVMAMMLAPSFSAFAQTGKSNTSGSWQVENNAWVFRNAEGQSVKGWVVYNQEWYYLNPENGQLKTGWLQLDGKWYFLSTESGAQQGRLLTGWQWIDGYCYYLMPTDDSNYGVLVVNGRTPDGYYVNQSGQWLHGENGDAVYETGKGLPSAASSQQVAGASRALPGQVLGASRAIAAPGGGSFGGGGGGGSTGGGATASTTGGAGTATTGTSTAGAATTGTSTGTATGGSAAGTATPSTEGTGASTGTETPGTQPETPVTPVQPENPTQPETPVTPAQPENPTQPETPVTPAQPENPTQPETPVTPTQPENPTQPETPVTPAQPENPTQPETPAQPENPTQPETPVTPAQPENPTQPETPVTPTQPETPAQPENPTQPETPAQPENPTQPETPETPSQPENNLKNWPGTHTLSYDAAKDCFVLSFDEGKQIQELQELLLSINKVTVNQTEYAVGDAKTDLSKEANTYCHDLRGKEKVRGYLNALNFNKKSFHEGENTIEIQADGYNPVIIHINATKEELQDEKLTLKKPEKLTTPKDFDRTEAGEYNVKLFAFNNLSEGQKEYLSALNEVVIDDVHYQKIEEKYFDDFVRLGKPRFFIVSEGTSITLNLNYYPKEAGAHNLTLRADGYEDLLIKYTQEKAKSAPVMNKLEKKEAQGYYELSFQGDRKSVQNYLKSIKTLTVAGRTYGQMAPFSADLLKMGEKFSFGDSKGEKELADLLLFSIPTDNVDKEQEIRIEAEGYEVATIPLS
ncbi:hemoblobin-interacting domain-containing protein [uncultured Oribacterium sp.]|uniref:hemoblobin-interacting domain-containing protein n=1 Tax=uncultured Oribacterium sp. TaxID=462198 RepID=UPI0028040ECE|nr:hemoblobin-interacting domain-containing protein [uncultured Oribacterium sp.]